MASSAASRVAPPPRLRSSAPTTESAARRWLARRGRRAWRAVRVSRIPAIAVAALATVLLGAVVVERLETSSVRGNPDFGSFDNALWWAVETILTVGYGDVTPRTPLGRVAATVVMLTGVTVISLFTATVASTLTERRLREGTGLQQVRSRNHVLVCGANNHLESILEGLLRLAPADRTAVTLVNELPDDEVQALLVRYEALQVRFVRGDFTHEAVLRRANAEHARAAIILASTERHTRPPDERTLLATLAIKHLRTEVQVCAELLDSANAAHLRIAQADDIVVTGEHTGYLLASAAFSPGIPQALRALASPLSDTPLARAPIPEEFVGRSFRELARHFRMEHHAILIGLVTEEEGIPIQQLLAGRSPIDVFIAQRFQEAGRDLAAEARQKADLVLNPADDREIQPEDAAVLIGRPRGEAM